MDVVPPGNLNDWTVNPFKPAVKKGYLIGRGANDMKSSIAAFVTAVSNFSKINKKFDFDITDEILSGCVVTHEGDIVNNIVKDRV